MLADVFVPPNDLLKNRAECWFNPNREWFQSVCDLAYVDPKTVMQVYNLFKRRGY